MSADGPAPTGAERIVIAAPELHDTFRERRTLGQRRRRVASAALGRAYRVSAAIKGLVRRA